MALTVTSLVLFVGLVASWVKLPGSMSATETPSTRVAATELAPQAS